MSVLYSEFSVTSPLHSGWKVIFQKVLQRLWPSDPSLLPSPSVHGSPDTFSPPSSPNMWGKVHPQGLWTGCLLCLDSVLPSYPQSLLLPCLPNRACLEQATGINTHPSLLHSQPYFLLLLFSCSVVSNSSRPHGLQHARLPRPPYLLELPQTHVHWVGDAIQPSCPLSSPSPPALNLSQHQGLFWWVGSLHQVTEVLEL